MKKITKSVALALLVAAMGCNALANGPRGHFPHGQRSYQGRGHDSGWVAPLLFLGLAGAVIGAAASQQSAPPPPTYVSPSYESPPVVYMRPAPPQPVNAWYFCKSVGQYYPYTQYCPEGWQMVSPTPQ